MVLLADIRVNQSVLEAAFKSAISCRVERLLFTGNLIGYDYGKLQDLQWLAKRVQA